MTRNAAPGRRLGFTLIELLVVLVIIGILIALLVPAIASAVKNARGAAVQAEISNIAQALADFKNKFGDYPPSRIAIREDGGYFPADTTALGNAATNDVTSGTLFLRGANAFRKFWPRVTMVNGSPFFAGTKGGAPSTGWYDFNGDGVFAGNTRMILQGNECLVFFLGGIPQPSFDSSGNVSGILGVTGFGKNPLNPFSNSIPPTGSGTTGPPSPMVSANRNAPLYEFNAGRLRLNTTTNMAIYVDSLNGTNNQAAAYYAYFSTNNGSGYDPNDLNSSEMDNNGLSPLTLKFLAPQGTTTSPSPNPYTTGPPFGVSNISYINAQSFQIFSSGTDGVFGVGGFYNTATTGGQPLPNYAPPSASPPAATDPVNSTDPQLRVFEWDNLTNFHNGRLQN